MPPVRQSIRLLPLLAFAAVLSGASLACTADIPVIGRTITPSPTVTPTATETPTATRTFTPSKTPTPMPTALNIDWPLVLNETFNNNRNGWMTGYYDDPVVKGSINITGGKYLVKMTPNDSIYWWVTPNLPSFKDFFLSVDVKKNTISPNAEYGMIFRVTDNFGYIFSINALKQAYHIAMLYENGWTNVTEWTSCPEIDPNGVNQIALLAKGSRFLLYVNGKEIADVVDGTLTNGWVGIGWVLFDGKIETELEFDNFLVRAPAN